MDRAHLLKYRGESYTSHFMLVKHIQHTIKKEPSRITPHVIEILEQILKERDHDKEKLSTFLFRECAETLVYICVKGQDELKKHSYNILKSFSINLLNIRSLPCSRALGMLPCNIKKYQSISPTEEDISQKIYELSSPQEIIDLLGPCQNIKKLWMGRSYLHIMGEKIVVFKFVKKQEGIESLLEEAAWMLYLHKNKRNSLKIPTPIERKGHFLFSSREWNSPFICFVVDKSYYIYPNGRGLNDYYPSWEEFLYILKRGAYLLGDLTSQGIIHTCPIPLFHNRIQISRREDRGIYLWERGGRLDRWLHSSLYPNIGKWGIRDLEHLQFYQGNQRELFRHIGTHILSLLLMAGSYFRMREPKKIGLNKEGNPYDMRRLFSKNKMQEVIHSIVKSYFTGFVGEQMPSLKFEGMGDFVEKLIQEMGVDRHMTEFLRIRDQEEMSQEEFEKFLRLHGYTPHQITEIKKGEKDISLLTGPHLGEFNGRISVPEIIPFLAGVAGMVISSKHLIERHPYGISP